MDRDRPNGITALRFFLAAAVVVFHAWPLGGFGLDPVQVLTSGQARNGGSIAIMAFFGLSGYLLLQSRQRSSPVAFAWRRALRIFPGYWISIIATAFIVGPWYLAFAWFPGPGVGASVNASLWTLFPEIICYAVLALVPTRALVVVVPGLIAGLALVSMSILPMGFAGELVGMFLAFGIGSLVALMGLRPSTLRAAALLLVLVAATALDRWMVAMPLRRRVPRDLGRLAVAAPLDPRPLVRHIHLRVSDRTRGGRGRRGESRHPAVHPGDPGADHPGRPRQLDARRSAGPGVQEWRADSVAACPAPISASGPARRSVS